MKGWNFPILRKGNEGRPIPDHPLESYHREWKIDLKMRRRRVK